MLTKTKIDLKSKNQKDQKYEIEMDDFGPEKMIEVYDPAIGMRGFLVIDNTVLGLGKGGMRMAPNVTKQEVYRLARVMTWKNALAGIDFGGAKSGIIWNGGTDEEKKAYVQSFARAIEPFIPKQYIAAPDVGTGEREMQWFVEAINEFDGATGKPGTFCKGFYKTKHCGIPHEVGSTGYGVAQSTKAAIEFIGKDIKDITVAIHGFGNVGSFAFKFLKDMGARVIAVADVDTAFIDQKGLSSDLFDLTKSNKSLKEYKGNKIETMKPEDLLLLDVDVLIPASVTDVINEDNKEGVRAKMIVEGGNIPMRDNIEEELHEKGVLIIPDFVANSGGVLSSYAEHKGYSIQEMFRLLDEKMGNNTKKVLKYSVKNDLSPRRAGLKLAKEIIKNNSNNKS
ncbi:MAG: Glu/Leu/Phe/Val dehydrogenase dimerization domain-containing protein [Candidatus Spechtbacterales bacterium]|nr:Glu/Leu/Phe/Val dehydrogenase dimerization domain-containing protein [Candidatus Spechtbacterales bacterium]